MAIDKVWFTLKEYDWTNNNCYNNHYKSSTNMFNLNSAKQYFINGDVCIL